jgi:outer membrane lipoprotein-sorting protein
MAACLALVVVLFVSGGRQSAFASALERFRSAATIVCRVTSPTPLEIAGLKIEQSGKLYISAEYGTRFEAYGAGILASVSYTPLDGPMVVVNPPARNYMVIDEQGRGAGVRDGARPDEFVLALRKLTTEADRELGQITIDGVEAVGYEISGKTLGLGAVDEARSELWVDANTRLPVRYVTEVPGMQPGTTLTLVYDQFEWDKPLDPQLFEPEIPPDFARLDATIPVLDEAALLDALAKFAELTGRYPTTMSMPTIVGALASETASRAAAGEELDQQTLVQESVEIGAGCAFYQKLANNGHTPEYYGATVQPGDANSVLLRWKLDEHQWRVIYGDLSSETVAAD